MKNVSVKKLILAALFSALTFVSTMIIQIPTPTNGYVNLGDCMVLISGFILGPIWGGFAAGLGSALADLVAYPVYAPATFVIKFFVALVASLFFKLFKNNTLGVVVSGIIGEIIMVLGYFVYEAFVIGFGWATAATGIPSNIFQAIAGVCSATLLIQAFIARKKKSSDEDFNDFPDDEN